jgi:hypothetical protein
VRRGRTKRRGITVSPPAHCNPILALCGPWGLDPMGGEGKITYHDEPVDHARLVAALNGYGVRIRGFGQRRIK